MEKEFSTGTREIVLGIPPYSSSLHLSRTPLHVPFSSGTNCVPAEELKMGETDDPERFNAIGSLLFNSTKHRPVIDVDGGARVQKKKGGSKVILRAAYEGTYRPDSMLRDILGDHGIETEVFTHPVIGHSRMGIGSYIDRMQVGAIVLRSSDKHTFEVVDSTSESHSHLYIQESFSKGDHGKLIKELGSVGMISPGWQALVAQEGMSIVRTPWTEKEVDAPNSY